VSVASVSVQVVARTDGSR